MRRNGYKWILGLALAALPWLLPSKAQAEEIGVEHLRIVLEAKGGRKLPKTKKARSKYLADWKKACEQIGKAMTVEKGPWGFGVFGSYSCYQSDKLVSGQDRPTKWALSVVDGMKDATFTVTHQTASGKQEVGDITLAASENTFQFFQDDEFTDAAAYSLLKSMPFGMLIAKGRMKGEPPTFTGRYWRAGKAQRFKYGQVPEAPESLTLYRIAWDDQAQAWKSEVVGSAKQVKLTEPKKKKKKKHVTLQGGEVVYETTPAVSEALASGPLFAQDSRGPGADGQQLAADLKEDQTAINEAIDDGKLGEFLNGNQSVLTSLLDTAASGYVGLRYGLEVLPGEKPLGPLLNKTQIFGLLVEVRGGPLKGLRYYYDKMPKQKAKMESTDGDVDTSIEFSRHTLGYSFDFNPGFLVDRVTIDPKLGLWTFNATLPTSLQGDKVERVSDFNLGSTYSLALEVGLEELSDWYTLRGWYAINTGFSPVKSGGKITSNRVGFDAYFTAGPVIPVFGVPFKTALLAFYYYENVNITSASKATPAPGEDKISGISYVAGYAGGGVAISW